MGDKYVEQTCVCMWNEIHESEGGADNEGGLKNFHELVNLWYRNLEEYAVNGTVKKPGKLPFAVQFFSRGWFPELNVEEVKKLRDYFCEKDMSEPKGQRRKIYPYLPPLPSCVSRPPRPPLAPSQRTTMVSAPLFALIVARTRTRTQHSHKPLTHSSNSCPLPVFVSCDQEDRPLQDDLLGRGARGPQDNPQGKRI